MSPEDRREDALRRLLLEVLRAEERHRGDHGRYTDELFALRGDGDGPLEIGPAGRLSITEATATGFSAVARQAPVECALQVGTAERPRSYVRSRSVVYCL